MKAHVAYMAKAVTEIATHWNVITGGPCTGKTTVIEHLGKRGYKTTIEHARHYIDLHEIAGETVEEIRSNKRSFQMGVLEMQSQAEEALNADDTIFLDRALPDSLAYFQFLGLEYDYNLVAKCRRHKYHRVFILDRLPLINDYARLENEAEQIRIHKLIIEVYEHLGNPVVFVPVLPPEERVDFILKHI